MTHGELVLYSFTPFGEGRVNITPLTDLMTRLALDASGASAQPGPWFENPVDWALVAEQWQMALLRLGEALETAGFVLPTPNFDPLAAEFTAAPGDPYDDLLEAIAAAIEENPDVEDYEAFARLFVAGEPLPSPPASSLLPSPTGDGAVLGELNGATGTVDGMGYTFAAEAEKNIVSWGKAGVSESYNFLAYKPTDSGPGFDPLTAWRLFGVPAAVGIHTCGEKAEYNTFIRLDRNGTNTLISECKIEILESTPNTVKGRFSAKVGDETLTDGFFQVLPANGGGGGLGPSEEALVFTLGGTEYKYTNVVDPSFETYTGVQAAPTENTSPGFPLGIQVHTVPDAVGTYACDQTYDGNDYRKVNVWFSWNGTWYYAGRRQNPAAGPAGSSCTIELTKVGSTVEGTFSGTFVTEDLQSSVVVSGGAFRLIK